MAFTTPRTWVTGELVTAAMLNEQISDNIADLDGRYYYGGYPIGSASASYYHLGQATAGNTPVQSEMRLCPIWVPRAVTLDRIGIRVGVGAASSSIRLGLYNDSGFFRPTTLRLEAPSVSSTAVANVEAIINHSLTPGTYWVAAVSQGGAPSITVAGGNDANYAIGDPGLTALGSEAEALVYYQTGVTGPLPASVGTLLVGTESRLPPRVAVRVV